MRTTPSLVSAVFVQLAASACTRKGISTALDNFFLAAITKQPLFTAPEVKISSNGYPQTSLQSTPYANITWLERPDFKVQALDVPACQVARYTVTRQKNSTGGEQRALVSVRLALSDNDGPITELEILNIKNGSHYFFRPDRFEDRTPALYNSSQAFPLGANLLQTAVLPRKDIIAVANTYIDGVQTGQKTAVKAGPTCLRVSNGEIDGSHCDQGLEQFKWPIENRRWIADLETGIAFGSMIFRGALQTPAETGDVVNEFIAVKDGRIREIRAAVAYSKKDIKSAWPEDATRSYLNAV
ncbi:hypothetical protein Vi05172_g6172 [Venturia inaequalis]|nr:hypothetical protein Vi05172_g6172 [Venturia inaequalis]